MMTELTVQDLPAVVLRKIVSDAKKRGISLNDTVVGILADTYGIEREPTSTRFTGAPIRTSILLTMPEALHRAIKMDAAGQKGVTMRGLIIAALANHYGVKEPSNKRRARGTTTATGGKG
jgi:hypothetical protein